MQYESGKTYLTAGGYIVTIKKDEYGFFYSDKPNPGVNSSGSSCEKVHGKKHGWQWNGDGTIPSLAPEWTEKLRIVSEFNLPEIPEGYEFADEYPMFRILKKGEYAYRAGWSYVIPAQVGSSLPYIALKKKEPIEVWPKYYKRSNGKKFFNGSQYIRREQDKPKCFIFSGGKEENYYDWNSGNDEYVKDGVWVEVPESEVKEWLGSHKEPAKESVKESPTHIPFSGAGQYRLANGQIANLDSNKYCKSSDNIEAANGKTYVFEWRDDGTIYEQLGFDDHSHLYLVEKIVEEVYPKYYRYGSSAITCRKSKDEYDQYYSYCIPTLNAPWTIRFDDDIKNGSLVEITEKEYWELAKTFYHPPQTEEVVSEEVVSEEKEEKWPKYYETTCGLIIYRKSKDKYDLFYDNLTPSYERHWDNQRDNELNEYRSIIEITKEEFWEKAKFCTYPPDPVKYDKEPILDRKAALKSYIQYKPEDFTKSYGNYFSDPQKETQMTPETAQKIATSTVSTVGKYGFKAANYFMIEPIVNIAKPILRSFRYAVCVGTLATGFYAYHNPDVVKDTIKSCLPKITVESPEIFQS